MKVNVSEAYKKDEIENALDMFFGDESPSKVTQKVCADNKIDEGFVKKGINPKKQRSFQSSQNDQSEQSDPGEMEVNDDVELISDNYDEPDMQNQYKKQREDVLSGNSQKKDILDDFDSLL